VDKDIEFSREGVVSERGGVRCFCRDARRHTGGSFKGGSTIEERNLLHSRGQKKTFSSRKVLRLPNYLGGDSDFGGRLLSKEEGKGLGERVITRKPRSKGFTLGGWSRISSL